MYIGSDTDTKILPEKVVCSFGAGDWVDGTEAAELLEDMEGRWLAMSLNSMSARVVLDRRVLCEPFDSLESELLGRPISLSEAYDAFERLGEVNIPP